MLRRILLKVLGRVVTPIAIFFISLELILRIYAFLISPNNKLSTVGAYPIFTLGESTTRRLPKGGDWPLQLEGLLNEKFKAVVYNEAVAAITTPHILRKTPQHLSFYSPKLVITMMGTNDSSVLWPKKFVVTDESFLANYFKTYKLIKFLRSEINEIFTNKRKWVTPDLPNGWAGYPDVEGLSDRLIKTQYNSKEYDQLLSEIAAFLEPKSNFERAQFYNYAALTVVRVSPIIEKDYNLHKGLDFYILAAKFDPRVGETINYGLEMVNTTGEHQHCRYFIDAARRENIRMNDTFLLRASMCIRNDEPELKKLFGEAGDIYEFRPASSESPIKESYLKMAELIEKAGICWIAMEYPNLEYSEGIRAVMSLGSKRIFSLSNLDNFKAAHASHSYEEIFTDKFGVQFGHATTYGNSLIAENVFNLIMKLKREGLCGL